MSYVVLARKWRPMVFEDVVSQSHITTTLKNAIQQNRIASAYLFSGPRGVGKTTTARILAKAINCQNGPTPTPCNECSSCKEITESRSLDVFEIDGASNRGIDEIRNLRENLRYAPSKGKHKIYIIDEVHMLTTEAFNALLKTLEEPPAKVLFIFATTEAHKVPATILSRCQRYDFRRIPLVEIVEQLQHICQAEDIEIDEESLYLIGKKSDGSMRDSQSLLDQVVSFCGQNIRINDVAELLGVIDQELFFECSDCLANRDIKAGLKLVDAIFAQGHDLGEFLNGMVEHFRNLLVYRTTAEMALLEGLESFSAKYETASRAFSDTDLLRMIQLASEASYQIKRSPNPKMILEMLLVKMIKMEKSVELNDLITRISNLKKQVPNGDSENKPTPPGRSVDSSDTAPIKQIHNKVREPAPEVKSQTEPKKSESSERTPVETSHPESLETIKKKWAEIIDGVKSKKIHLGSFLNEGYPTGIDDGVLEISFGKENGFHISTLNKNRMVIQKTIFEQTGMRIQIQCKKNESKEFTQILKQHQPEENSEPSDNKRGDTMQIPIVKKIIEVFDGEIVQ